MYYYCILNDTEIIYIYMTFKVTDNLKYLRFRLLFIRDGRIKEMGTLI